MLINSSYSHLPIDDFLNEIEAAFARVPSVIITAAPGAGKTTRLPPYLARLSSGKVLVLEPRRMAAVSAAARIAEEQSWKLGEQVGYQVRFENKTSKNTQLIFMTEALLNRLLLDDPELRNVEYVVLDEFHERSLHVDLALGLLKELQDLGRKIKLVIMSATLNAARIKEYLGNAEIITVPGQLFPLEVRYQKEAQRLTTGSAFSEALASVIKAAQRESQRDILVFVPGVGEIERLLQELHSWAAPLQIELVPLHGRLKLDQQRRALRRGNSQRVIVSTNIAESSVTVDGVDTVIDSGLVRILRFDHRTDFSRLDLTRISLSSAIQRAGRAARQYPGKCIRLWTKHDELSMPADEVPEIQRSDLTESLLFLAAQGVRDFTNFSWFEVPSAIALARGLKALRDLETLDNEGRPTPLGRKLLKYPLPLSLGKLLTLAEQTGQTRIASVFAVLLQERDFVIGREPLPPSHDECDLTARWHILNEGSYKNQDRRFLASQIQVIKEASDQIFSMVSTTPIQTKSTQREIQALLLKTFKHRLCRRRGPGLKGVMVGGRGVVLDAQTQVRESEFFLALQGIEGINDQETLVHYASGIPKNLILQELSTEIETLEEPYFDEVKGLLYRRQQKVFKGLALENPVLSLASEEDIQTFLPDLLTTRFEWTLTQNEFLNSWVSRLAFFRKHSKDFQFELTPEVIRSAFEAATMGEKRLEDVLKKDLVFYFEQTLPHETIHQFKSQVPEKIKVPSGSSHPIVYSENIDPYVQVRIQEIYGLLTTPTLLNGRIRLTFQLLGPNYRVVQTTSDLTRFWEKSYHEIRKELRARYPKHHWPEDPLTAKVEMKKRPLR